MMKLFRRYILGGKSDKTEGTLLAFLIGVAWVTYAVVQTARGVDMEAAWPFLTAYTLTTVAAFTGAAVVHHLKPPAPGAAPGQGGQARYPEGDWPLDGETTPSDPLRRGDVGA
jgi:hypothetical protein